MPFRSPVVERGLAFDREWMIVDGDGRFVTQRDLPQLALVEPSLTATASLSSSTTRTASRGAAIRSPGTTCMIEPSHMPW